MNKLAYSLLAVVIVAAMFVSGCNEKENSGESNSSTEDLKAIAGAFFEQGQVDRIDEMLTADFVYHGTNTPGVRTREDYKRMAIMSSELYPDLEFTIQDTIAEGDKVVLRWTVNGTRDGKQETTTGISILRFVDAKIAEIWTNTEGLGRSQ